MNVARHAAAANCTVRVHAHDGLHVEVLDDGVGLASSQAPGVGMRSMRERAAELGGQCTVESRSPTGTRVYAWLPIAKGEVDGQATRPDRG
jgi:signal transduction histidine kinase